MKATDKLNDVPLMRFTYGLALVSWVLIAMGLAWVAVHADRLETHVSQAPAAKAALAQPAGLATSEPQHETAPKASPGGQVNQQPAPAYSN